MIDREKMLKHIDRWTDALVDVGEWDMNGTDNTVYDEILDLIRTAPDPEDLKRYDRAVEELIKAAWATNGTPSPGTDSYLVDGIFLFKLGTAATAAQVEMKKMEGRKK